VLKISSSPLLAGAKKLLGFAGSDQIKADISENNLVLHQQALQKLEILNQKMIEIDHERSSGSEFLGYVKIKISLEQGSPEYQNLQHSAEMLQVGLRSQNSFLKISQIEGQFFSSKQQEFYQFVFEQIHIEQDLESFKAALQTELDRIVPLLRTDDGRIAMQSYLDEINKIASHRMGLKLFASFKTCDLTDFSTLKTVADIASTIHQQKLLDISVIRGLVVEKFGIFEKLSPVIGISKEHNNPETYARILQFMGLQDKYADSYLKFQELLVILQKWEKSFKSIAFIRQSFDPNQYKIPAEFIAPIPGHDIYKKYCSLLPKK
jgi:hypothetical protein